MEPKEMTTPEQVLDALGDHIIDVMNDREMRGSYMLCRLLDRYIELLRTMPGTPLICTEKHIEMMHGLEG